MSRARGHLRLIHQPTPTPPPRFWHGLAAGLLISSPGWIAIALLIRWLIP